MIKSEFYLDKLVAIFEATVAQFTDRELLVESTLSRNDRGIGGEREVNTWIRHQISLELVQINIQGAIETQRSYR